MADQAIKECRMNSLVMAVSKRGHGGALGFADLRVSDDCCRKKTLALNPQFEL